MARLQDFQTVTPTDNDNLLVVQATGQGLASFGSTIGNKAPKSDLASISITGTTNNSGSTISAGTFFYLNGTLVRAKQNIQNNATFTTTNKETVTAGGLNELVTPKLITPTYTTGVSYVSGGIYQIGKIVVVQLRLSLTSSFSGGADMISGLPAPETSGSSYLRFWTINGTVSISAAGVIGGYDVAAGTIIINGTYICS